MLWIKEVEMVESVDDLKSSRSISAEYAARHFGRFPHPHSQPTNSSEVGVRFFGIFAAVNLAVIDTVMAHVNVHIDCHLMSCHAFAVPGQLRVSFFAWRFPKALQECVEIMATRQHHSTHNTQDHTHTYQHQQLAHKQCNTPQNLSRTSRSMEEGRRRRCAWRPCPECQIDMPRTATGSVGRGQTSLRRTRHNFFLHATSLLLSTNRNCELRAHCHLILTS